MLIDLTPLVRYREFRLLFLGQLVSFIGTMISYVAAPYQLFQLTGSSAMVGMLGVAEIVPLFIFGLIGGSVADVYDRRKVLLFSEAVMTLCTIGLTLNSMLAQPRVWLLFLLVVGLQIANGFHRPAMDALNQKLVLPKDYASVGALNSFRWSAGAIGGPALGGLLIAGLGPRGAFAVDAGTFLFSLILLAKMRPLPKAESPESIGLERIREGLRYALGRPELIGTYVIDIVAMTFAFPGALFPEMSQDWGGAQAAGLLYSGMAGGSLLMTLFSGWTKQIKRPGSAVVLSAIVWGSAIVLLGFAHSLPWAFACLVLAGGADMTSGLFRGLIWNQTIPNTMRGRLAGLEMISYMSGPLLGNARAGYVASFSSLSFSIVSGGVLCIVSVIVCAILLPAFWAYQFEPTPLSS